MFKDIDVRGTVSSYLHLSKNSLLVCLGLCQPFLQPFAVAMVYNVTGKDSLQRSHVRPELNYVFP